MVSTILAGIATGASVFALSIAITNIMRYKPVPPEIKVFKIYRPIGWIVEEVIYRWALLGFLLRGFPTWLSLIISSAIFALAHPLEKSRLIISFVAGMLYGICFLEYGILAAIIAHLTTNFLVFFLLGWIYKKEITVTV